MIKYLVILLLACNTLQAQYFHQIPLCYDGIKPVLYNVPYNSQYQYNYQVTNGTVVNYNNGNVLVDWNDSPGSGQLTITVTNDLNCGSNINLIMETLPCNLTTIYTPNAFTPNNNGKNDSFKVKGTNLRYFELTIYDRWGTELFFTRNINHGWNGKYKGRKCHQAVYAYKVFYQDHQNQFHTIVGKTSLIR